MLGRDDIGSLEPGKCADFVAFSMNRVEFAGALHDPVAALLFASPTRADHNYVQGKAVVSEGQLVGVDLSRLIEQHNRAALELVG